ncbi:hypothetical protein BDN70DRAFT_974936 [Pholiota conissans]|uniref:Transmembrane protein 135 N-terminal domain-containing protein n=1 Tax=Pholiota conissans TaxID=109636 RepID=A0A9P5Z5J2_9AGAR|nr:hypothetical protein BDN70DRAFT_974936 [Pholiota conissans]
MDRTGKQPPPSRPTTVPQRTWLDHIPTLSDEPTHPAQIALRTYALALSLSLGPSFVPFFAALLYPIPKGRGKAANGVSLRRVLRRELGYDGFAFAITLAVAGGAALRCYLWPSLTTIVQKERAHGAAQKEGERERQRTNSSASSIIMVEYISTGALNAFNVLCNMLMWLSPVQQTFLSNALSATVGVILIQAGRNRTTWLRAARRSATYPPRPVGLRSPTLDLTLLLVVRAVDSIVQALILQKHVPAMTTVVDGKQNPVEPRLVHEKLVREKVRRENEVRRMWTSQVDAFVFWACSARIMWCFFYEPQRHVSLSYILLPLKLPRSYVKWINTLSRLDGRIVTALQRIRDGSWSYISGSSLHAGLLQQSAIKMGLPSAWGDPNALPAYGGSIANEAWKALGITNRPGVGGIPCELLHQEVGTSLGLGSSCTANAALRTLKGFMDALAIYLPVHFLPVLLTRPQTLMRPHRLLATLFGALRSATFLSSFIGLYWYAVCLTRSLVLARVLPFVSHDFWDGPYGCIMAGCLMCGSSIWIENGRRRGEMALYVLPRAIRAILPNKLIKNGNRSVKLAEQLAFVLSFSTLLTSAAHQPDSLRGLSRWTLAFVTNGPNAGFWKRKRRDPSVPPTPSFSSTPFQE